MSSWLSISLPNPFNSDDDQNPTPPPANDQAPSPPTAGVTDDLSVLRTSIGHQLRGVADFFAPPPLPRSPSPPEPDESEDGYSSQALAGIKNDLAEIGGTLRSSFSRLASNLLQRDREGNELKGDEEEESEDYEVAGTSDGVLDFVRELSLRPELWTDFPLPLDNDFHMSDAQQEHASTIEALVPSLATLRVNTCSHLSEGKFWMIYFLFLLPRLHEDDIEVLSTPEVLETRERLLQKLQNKRNEPAEASGDVTVSHKSAEKEVKTDEENTKQCPEEESVDASTSRDTQKQTEHVEKVSCSDLEDDNNDLSYRLSRVNLTEQERVPSLRDAQKQSEDEKGVSFSDNERSHRMSRVNPTEHERVPSPTESIGWVRVGESSSRNQCGGGQETPRGKGSDSDDSTGGWHNVDEVDLDIHCDS